MADEDEKDFDPDIEEFRMAYPAHIYVTVRTGSEKAARRKLVELLSELQDGIIIHIADDDLGIDSEVLYPDSNRQGEIDPRKILIEDVLTKDEEDEPEDESDDEEED